MRALILPSLIALITIAACKKDKNDNNPPSIVGKWKQIAGYNEGPRSCSCWTDIEQDISAYKLEFKRDNTFDIQPPMYMSAAYCPSSYTLEGDTALVWTTGVCGISVPSVTSRFVFEDKNTLVIEYSHIPNYFYKMKFKRVRSF